MIKFAVTRPKQRIESINHGVGMLKWNEDPYLKHFGMNIDPNMTLVSLLFKLRSSLLTFQDRCPSSPEPRGPIRW
jgi:hypothetical protein